MNFRDDTRGFRNNNPGNIRFGNDWIGEIVGTDKSFEAFRAVEYGIRAIHLLIDTYRDKYHDVDALDIIARYAPSNENNTSAYVNSVVDYINKLTGKNITSVTNLHETGVINELVAAIIKHENGFNPFSVDFIKSCKNVK